MAIFVYTARRPSGGQVLKGELDVPSREDVLSHLQKQRLIPVNIREKGTAGGIRFQIGTGIKTRDLVIFTRQFSTMINSGLPLVQSLDILAKQSENPALRSVIRNVLQEVESGSSLAESLAQHPKVFTALYVNMVAAGEAGGILDTILLRLAQFLEKSDALSRKIRGAMVYPAVILFVAVAAVAILLTFVIPTFQNMFASVGVALPLPTQIVVLASQALQSFWWLMVLAVIGAVAFVRSFYQTSAGRLTIDRILLTLPIFGDLQRKAAVARFTRTLGTLVASGVAILEGLEITARTAGNRVIHDAVMKARTSIASGETISNPLKESGVFPPMVIQMINVGEQTGGLDEMLAKIADFYDDEVDSAVETLLSAMEPIMIIFLGGVVGGMIAAMYLPIFDMINTVG